MTILYHLWNPLARLSLMKKVCENTKPCCSSPKKMGPSRPGHTWREKDGWSTWRDGGQIKQVCLFCVWDVWLTHTYIHADVRHCLPHSWGCVHKPGGPRWTAEVVWDAGDSGNEYLFHHQYSRSLDETQAEIDTPVKQGQGDNQHPLYNCAAQRVKNGE